MSSSKSVRVYVHYNFDLVAVTFEIEHVDRTELGVDLIEAALIGDHLDPLARRHDEVMLALSTHAMALSEIEPKSDFRGLRASRDLVRQVVGRLRDMEREFFDGRQ